MGLRMWIEKTSGALVIVDGIICIPRLVELCLVRVR